MNWALICGEKRTGITFLYLEEEMDSGDIIAQREYEITPEDTCATLYEKATRAAVEMTREYIPLIRQGTAPRTPQDHARAVYAAQRVPADGLIDWHKSAAEAHNFVRALTKPYPGAFTYHNGKKLCIWQAKPVPDIRYIGPPGRIVKIVKDEEAWVLTGGGVLSLQVVQPEGGAEVNAGNYFRSIKTQLGMDYAEEIQKLQQLIARDHA